MQVAVITPPVSVPREQEQVARLFEAGLEILHVRKPSLNEEELRAYLAAIPDRHRTRIALHTHHELAQEFGISRIHFQSRKRPSRDAMPDPLPAVTLSTSVHTTKELRGLPRNYRYALLGPVFDSISKSDYRTAFDLSSLQADLRDVPLDVFAVGGVTPERLGELSAAGFRGVAVLGYVWQSSDPREAFDRLRTAALRLTRLGASRSSAA